MRGLVIVGIFTIVVVITVVLSSAEQSHTLHLTVDEEDTYARGVRYFQLVTPAGRVTLAGDSDVPLIQWLHDHDGKTLTALLTVAESGHGLSR